MNPALTHIQNDIRAAELHERAQRQRSPRLTRRSSRRTAEEIEAVEAASHAPAFGALFLGHGFFGREHGSHA
ncbi:hypothetical protein VSS74_16725 [Conexibacter stalactiti]|uniref:Uncharacterized protein n=1 Tax=Conexibacter stalactiti TaxID=1940611 RepID=A0ABU4HRP3_9ACTN|nr:hypothetical protein [Conexibacter stalactiti]MDW5595996.1 hypothetical protein [Conexibacter stalactiti]MEC5036638.1 hypothetical protein [Conexibacter stalactiti]